VTGYVAIIEGGAGPGYGVFFPDVPGCTSGGDTLTEAEENAAQALALFFEGTNDRPVSRPLKEIDVNPDVAVAAVVVVSAPPAGGTDQPR